MNEILEYCALFIHDCLQEFPEEIDDDAMIEDLLTWHEQTQFHL